MDAVQEFQHFELDIPWAHLIEEIVAEFQGNRNAVVEDIRVLQHHTLQVE